MKHLTLISLLLVAGTVASPSATAEPLRAEPGGLGGGFIELLMTGRDPGYAGPDRYGHAQPGAMRAQRGYGVRYAAPSDPLEAGRMPARSGDLAALSEPDALPMRREAPARFRRQAVAFDGNETPGTIVIDTANKYLYLVEGGGQATRYGIGVGRPGFLWRGTKTVSMKREWPDWRPPAEMLRRRPDLPRHMAGGIENPLGARALYLGSSLYRIHGTNEPNTIGLNVSSGCFRLTNDDVVDLYSRVRIGARVKVL